MSLLKQLFISVSVALLGILVGTLAFNLGAARSYLSEQLLNESENAAASLAMSLSQPANQDPVAQELLISALFDTGRFQAVRLRGADGVVQFEREQTPIKLRYEVPKWFQHLMPLPAQQAERAVSNGWSQLGSVEVRVDNRSAHIALWDSSLKMAALIVIAGLAWAFFVGYLMRWFRRVLQEEVTAQVQRIGTGREVMPWAGGTQLQELSGVSSAIRSAYVRVQKTEQAQLQRIESLELEANCDPVTQLPNRKYFLNELNKQLQANAQAHGYVLLIRQRDLQALNHIYSRVEVDDWSRAVTQQLRHLLHERQVEHAHIARINGSDFAVLLPQVHSLAATQEVQQLRKLLQAHCLSMGGGQWSRWAFALTPYAHGEAVSDVLVRLDHGLMSAESAGHGEVEYVEASAHQRTAVHTCENQWQQILSSALQVPGKLVLDVQAVVSVSGHGTEKRFEATLELHESDGQVLRASLFLPAASRLGLMDAFDLQGITMGLQWLSTHPGEKLVVRIALLSLEQEQFWQRLHALLDKHRDSGMLAGLMLELDAHALEVAAQEVQRLSALLQEQGVGLGFRRVEESARALLHIGSLPLSYVKLGAFWAEQAVHNLGARGLLEAIIGTVIAQRARVYVTDGVSPEAAQWLREQGAYLLKVNE